MPLGRLFGLMSLLVWGMLLHAQAPLVVPDVIVQRGLVYCTAGDTALTLDLYRAAAARPPAPVVLLVPGGSWSTNSREAVHPLALQLAGMGCAVAVVTYRLAPAWRFPAQLDDLRAAAAWVRDRAAEEEFDTQRLFLLGISAGGQLAGLLATQPDTSAWFAGVITLAAPLDLTVALPSLKARIILRMYLGAEQAERQDLYAAASPITYVSRDDPPFLLLHGQADPLVPPEQSARMARALRALGVPVVVRVLPGLAHEVPSLTSANGSAVLRDIQAYLQDPRAFVRAHP